MMWLQKALAEFPLAQETITTPDGSIYSLPFIQDGYHIRVAGGLSGLVWMNTTWMKKLGLAAPQTTEELAARAQGVQGEGPERQRQGGRDPVHGRERHPRRDAS